MHQLGIVIESIAERLISHHIPGKAVNAAAGYLQGKIPLLVQLHIIPPIPWYSSRIGRIQILFFYPIPVITGFHGIFQYVRMIIAVLFELLHFAIIIAYDNKLLILA
ncbi:hypothetical protein SDC9_148158 [bioreactor metagenome]|uniref:Uncharacterized protein n=1 Tax=bioreactor metagenome TaxID=1076179 RepID=A0A645EI09_9ZZZZ